MTRQNESGTEVREEALRGRLRFGDLRSADSHQFNLEFACSAAVLHQPVEQKMFAETFLNGRDAVTTDEILAHFAPAIRSATTEILATAPADRWLSDAGKNAIIDAIRQAAKPVAFACGVDLLPPFSVIVESPTLEHEKLEAMQRKLAERRAAGQIEHLQRAADLLTQFQSLREAAPQLSAGAILQRLSPADQGALLQTLLLASSESAASVSLFAVAGPNLIQIDTHTHAGRMQIQPLPIDAGPLRSVQGATIDGQRILLVGARSGILLVHLDSPAQAVVYAGPPVNSQLGYNRVVYHPETDTLHATHGEAGVVTWKRDEAAFPHRVISLDDLGGDVAPRNLQIAPNGSILFSAGARLWVMDSDKPAHRQTRSPSEIVVMIPANDGVLIVHQDGMICSLNRANEITPLTRHASRISAAAPLPWMGGQRLLLASDSAAIDCVGVDDPLITRYLSHHQAPRILAAASHCVAAVSADRQRIILWPSWDGSKPQTEVYITPTAKHRVADIEFC